MLKLTEGKIPAATECPFRNDCPSVRKGDCGHKGAEHTVPYSCGLARLFDIFGK